MLDQFVKMTQRIIAEDGFDNYLPTLLLPATREVRVLDQVDGGGESLGITDWLAEQVDTFHARANDFRGVLS